MCNESYTCDLLFSTSEHVTSLNLLHLFHFDVQISGSKKYEWIQIQLTMTFWLTHVKKRPTTISSLLPFFFAFSVPGLRPALLWLMASKDLEELLGHHGVEPSTISSMMAEGWSLSTFALWATSLKTFDPLTFNSDASALQQARLIVCWREAH